MRPACTHALAVVLFLLAAAPVHAAVIPWAGTVASVEIDTGAGLYSGTIMGDGFSGSFDIGDSCAPLSCIEEPQAADEINYVFPGGSGFLTDGTDDVFGAESSVNIQNDHIVTALEAQQINSVFGADTVQENQIVDVWTAASETANELGEWEIALVSLDASFFDSTAYQPNPPAGADLQFFALAEFDEDTDATIFLAVGTLTSVPEPASALLLAIAACALLVARRSSL